VKSKRNEGGRLLVVEEADARRAYLFTRKPFRVGERTVLKITVDGSPADYPVKAVRELGRQLSGEFKCEVVMWESSRENTAAGPCPYYIGQVIESRLKHTGEIIKARVVDTRWIPTNGVYDWHVDVVPLEEPT
jgi:hypothetical protein